MPGKPKVRFASQDAHYGFTSSAFDWSLLPDIEHEFLSADDLHAFELALQAPDNLQSPADDTSSLKSPTSTSSVDLTKRQSQTGAALFEDGGAGSIDGLGELAALQPPRTPSLSQGTFVTAQNDWAPIHPSEYRLKRGSKRKKRKKGRVEGAVGGILGTRTKDETREGYLYQLFKWPLLVFVAGWLLILGLAYVFTRWYIWVYEHFFTWRGQRQRLRKELRRTSNYRDWVAAAKELDSFLGRQRWKEENDFAYYDSRTIKKVWDQMKRIRHKAEAQENASRGEKKKNDRSVEELKALVEACVKHDFVGTENARLYSQTYYGTKNLVQNYVEEVEKSLKFLLRTKQLPSEDRRTLFKHISANYGRSALCLSGGATFAYYHLGVVRALLDQDLLPDVITGTSGGSLIAALVATRTNEELDQLVVPALAKRIDACQEPITVWLPRWWRTGARFDSLDWARRCSWWTRGSLTFREAYERTGRILNVSCVPADPHSPTILCNYLTSPECVIWSAVLASAAVPGILNPMVLMMKTRDGTLQPYSFGHKWKDGSLRTDIPLKALNTHFNVDFTVVSQVNPHVNLFFFSSRGSVGHPVTHRKGRGWRGGYLMSAFEHYLKLDMNKWLKFVRHAELLPRPLGQDWSQLWLQQFSGTITIWPKSVPSDFWNIITDPPPGKLARMIHEGKQSTFPKLKFVANRLRIERLVEQGRRETRPWVRRGSIQTIMSEEDLRSMLVEEMNLGATTEEDTDVEVEDVTGGDDHLAFGVTPLNIDDEVINELSNSKDVLQMPKKRR